MYDSIMVPSKVTVAILITIVLIVGGGVVALAININNTQDQLTSTTVSLGPSTVTTQQQPSATSGSQAVGVPVNILSGSETSYFSPSSITVVVGINNTVTWTNDDVGTHTVTADNEAFDSGYMDPGQSWNYTFTSPGTYPYHCTLHPWMKGTVIVKLG